MRHFLYRLAKTWIGATFLHWIFGYFSFAIPAEKLIETDDLLAFHHPSPSYVCHILIVPKSRTKSLSDLPSSDGAFEKALFDAVKTLVDRYNLEQEGYRLIANGGQNQEVKHLHFHLVSDKKLFKEKSNVE